MSTATGEIEEITMKQVCKIGKVLILTYILQLLTSDSFKWHHTVGSLMLLKDQFHAEFDQK